MLGTAGVAHALGLCFREWFGVTLARHIDGGLVAFERRNDFAIMYLAYYGRQRIPDILDMTPDRIIYWYEILDRLIEQENKANRPK